MTRLLLVDDDEGNRLTLSALLEDEGFHVDVIASFGEATQLLEAGRADYAAVLLDHSLGDGYGTDLIPLLRRALPGAKLIAMSGSVGADGMRRSSDAELPKGLHFPDFLSRLHALLGTAP
ncbi:MAG TPA: response regulator [Polyangiaceae bacterium]|jgi:CheY-like chemotaxis protein|nr:response regulator [Polyangiaceae bacterium]